MDSKRAFPESLPEAGDTFRSIPVWSCSNGKRLFDLCIATLLLGVSLPVMLVAALVIKCASRGPVLFRQERVGRNGRIFQVLKFRTMVHGKRNVGPGVTQQGDPRIFPAGRWLRKWKLDELPQFFNVVRGDMSLVGPRPDLPGYMARLGEGQREILSLRPGITGAVTLQFRHEEELLAQVRAEELLQFYTSRILPEKIRIDMAYAREANFFSDIKILLRTVATILR